MREVLIKNVFPHAVLLEPQKPANTFKAALVCSTFLPLSRNVRSTCNFSFCTLSFFSAEHVVAYLVVGRPRRRRRRRWWRCRAPGIPLDPGQHLLLQVLPAREALQRRHRLHCAFAASPSPRRGISVRRRVDRRCTRRRRSLCHRHLIVELLGPGLRENKSVNLS